MEGREDVGMAAGETEPAERRRLGRTGGALLMIGSLAALPAGLVLEPAPMAVEHLVSVAGICTGLAIWFAPWESWSPRALYLIPIVGTAEVMVGTAIFSDDFAFYQVLIGVYTAYLIRDRAHFFAFMTFFTLATIAPLAYPDESVKDQLHHILVTIPVLLISAGVVRYLRDALTQREREYRRFAAEAVALAERIRGGSPEAREQGAAEVDERLAELASKTRS